MLNKSKYILDLRFLKIATLCLDDSFAHSWTLLPWGLSLSRAFLQTPGMLSCAFFSGVASVWPLSHKAQIGEAQ